MTLFRRRLYPWILWSHLTALGPILVASGCGSDPAGERGGAEFDIDDGASAGESVQALASPDAETVLELKTGAKVVVPAGALTKEVHLSLKRPSDAEAKTLIKTLARTDKAVSAPYVLTPHGTKFQQDVEITLPIHAESDTNKLAVLWLEDENDKQWEYLGKPSPVVGEKKATIKLRHFSVLLLVERDEMGGSAGDGDGGDGDSGGGQGTVGLAKLGAECASDAECGSGLICESFAALSGYGIDEPSVCMPACTTRGEACEVGGHEGRCASANQWQGDSRLVCKVFNVLNGACGNRAMADCDDVQLSDMGWSSPRCRPLYEAGNEEAAVGFCVFGCEDDDECPLNYVRSSDSLWSGCCVLPTVVGQACEPYLDFENPSPSDHFVACSDGQTCEPDDPVNPTALVCTE